MDAERNAFTRKEFFQRNGISKERFYAEIGAGRLSLTRAARRCRLLYRHRGLTWASERRFTFGFPRTNRQPRTKSARCAGAALGA